MLSRFGEGFARHFFFPYNRKLYCTDPRELTTEWVGRYVPRPSLADVIDGIARAVPHAGRLQRDLPLPASGRHPAAGGCPCREAAGSAPRRPRCAPCTWAARELELDTGETVGWDTLVATAPLSHLAAMTVDLPAELGSRRRGCARSAVVNLNLGVRGPAPRREHWLYVPEERFPFYRVGIPSNHGEVAPSGCHTLSVEVSVPAGARPPRTWPSAASRALQSSGCCGTVRTSRSSEQVTLDPAYVIFDSARPGLVAALRDHYRAAGVIALGPLGGVEVLHDGGRALGRGSGGQAGGAVKPLRVMHAITMLELGGAQRNTLDTVASLDRGEFAVALACADEGELLAGSARAWRGRPLRAAPPAARGAAAGRSSGAPRASAAQYAAFGPEIVHTHSSKAGILGRLAAHREGVPVVIHSIHGFGFGPHQPPPVRLAFLAAERLASRWTTAFVAVSRHNLEDGVRLGLFPRLAGAGDPFRGRAGVVRGHRGGGALREALGIPAGAPLVVQIACFKPQKAPERFVEVAARLATRFPAAHFLLVGDGALRRRLERLRREAGLERRLHLPGWRRDVPAIFDAATVVTLTSRFEGLPRVLVEALAAGVPVVAMAVDGVPEVVRDGENGFLARAR